MSATAARPLENAPAAAPHARPLPRLGFLGVGWIGAHRLRAVAASGAAEVVLVADAARSAAQKAVREIALCSPGARCVDSLSDLLDAELDGIVIATPSAQHAEQARLALQQGLSVFCQKPLARTHEETARVVATARECDRLLRVDFSYREVAGVRDLAALVQSGQLGELFGVELVFHNAYGPDKPWFYELSQSGGGCVMDLGIHLVDLALWVLGNPAIAEVRSRLYSQGRLLAQPASALEDYAVAELLLHDGVTARLACSWRLSAGADAIIEATFYGTRGAGRLRNVNGSFYDFMVEHCEGTERRAVSQPPDEWGGRAICAWARRLATDRSFDADAEHLTEVAAVIDAIYGR